MFSLAGIKEAPLPYHAWGSLATLVYNSGNLSSILIRSTPMLMDKDMASTFWTRQSAIHCLSTLVWNPSKSTTGGGAALMPAQLRLRSLAVSSIGIASSPMALVQKLLHISADTLENLSSEFVYSTLGGDACLDLNRAHHLRSLHVAFCSKQARAVAAMLTCLCSSHQFPTLSSLSLCISLSNRALNDGHSVANRGTLWSGLFLPLSVNPLLHHTIYIDIRDFYGFDLALINFGAGPPRELVQQLQLCEMRLIRCLLEFWDVTPTYGVPMRGPICGSLSLGYPSCRSTQS